VPWLLSYTLVLVPDSAHTWTEAKETTHWFTRVQGYRHKGARVTRVQGS